MDLVLKQDVGWLTVLLARRIGLDYDISRSIAKYVVNYNNGIRTYEFYANGSSKSAKKRRAKRFQVCVKCARPHCTNGINCVPNTSSQINATNLIEMGVTRYLTESTPRKGTYIYDHVKSELGLIKYNSLKVKPK
uniref:Putative nucleic acid binding protein n=1 Tax=Melon yellowing-associated virus TaxID=255255 RepID=D1MYB5_9VIRU|nr:putative nucleic acid binding protein [Melon yellowing-associated virus]